MKRISLSLVVLAVLTTAITSCKKFLDRPPEGQMGENEAFKTEADVIAFSNGVYTLFGDGDFMGGRNQVLNELLGDEYKGDKFTGDFGEIFKRQNSIFGGTRDAYYNKGYRIIADANLLLNLPADARRYDMCSIMLEHLQVKEVKLITNNPLKLKALTDLGINVVERVPLTVGRNPFNEHYLKTKRERMDHLYQKDDF